MNAFYKSILNSKELQQSPKYLNILRKMFSVMEKYTNKYFMSGTSTYNAVSVKMTPAMRLREVKIDIEALVDATKASPESMEYLRILCNAIEQEVLSACNNAQDKIYKKAVSASEKLNNEN
jgi:DNA-binding protein YbaB